MSTDQTPRIDTVGGHGILRCRAGFYETLPEEAEVQGLDPDSEENLMWLPQTTDLTGNPPVRWYRHQLMPDCVAVDFTSGETVIFQMSYAAFDRLYTEWLSAQPRWPELN